jgi:hypothetical protein
VAVFGIGMVMSAEPPVPAGHHPDGRGMSETQGAWAGSWPAAVHVISLLVFSALCLVVAARFRWE